MMNRTTTPARLTLATLLAGLAVAATACAGGPTAGAPAPGGTGPASTSGAGNPAAFTQCLRDHGVDVADPGPSGMPELTTAQAADPAVDQALAACSDLMPAGVRGGSEPGELGELQAFAECMRENGLPDFPDPQPGADGTFAGSGVDRADPVFQAASEACQGTLAGGGR